MRFITKKYSLEGSSDTSVDNDKVIGNCEWVARLIMSPRKHTWTSNITEVSFNTCTLFTYCYPKLTDSMLLLTGQMD